MNFSRTRKLWIINEMPGRRTERSTPLKFNLWLEMAAIIRKAPEWR